MLERLSRNCPLAAPFECSFLRSSPIPAQHPVAATIHLYVCCFGQTAALNGEQNYSHKTMDRFNQLRQEYALVEKSLAYPYSLADFEELLERREAIRTEARSLAQQLNIDPPWFARL